MWCDCYSCNNMNAKDLVEKLQKVKITIKSEELGLSKQQLIEKRKIEREKEHEKAHKKMWENAEAAMYRINERVLQMKKLINEEKDEGEDKDLDTAMYRINERFLRMKKLINEEKDEAEETAEDPAEESEKEPEEEAEEDPAEESEEAEEEAEEDPAEESEEESEEEKPWKVGRVTY